jgi:hypothetical protein
MAHLGLGSTLLELKVLIQLWTQTPSQFELVSSIFFLNSSGQLTRVTFTLSAYPISPNRLTRILPEQLARTPPKRLSVVLKPNTIIRKRMDVNCSILHLRLFLGLSNPRDTGNPSDKGRLALYLFRVITLVEAKLGVTQG